MMTVHFFVLPDPPGLGFLSRWRQSPLLFWSAAHSSETPQTTQLVFFSAALSLVEILGHLTWVRHSSCKSSATHSHQCEQYFHVSKQCYGNQCMGFLTRTQMLLHREVVGIWGLCRHCKRVCTGSGLWEKNPLPQRGLKPASVLRLVFQSDTYQLSYPRPIPSYWIVLHPSNYAGLPQDEQNPDVCR